MAMAAAPAWNLDGTSAAATATGALSAEVLRDFRAVEPIWRALAGSGHATPYQSFEFAEAYFRAVEAPEGEEAALVLLRGSDGAPLALAPFSVRRKGPFRIARFIGGKHANFNMPVFAAGADKVDAETWRAALVAAGQLAGIDLFCLHAQPLEWQGFANPLAKLASMPSPSQGYKLGLQPDAEVLLKRRLSKDTRRKARQKEQRLQSMGAPSYRRPAEPAEKRAVLEHFLALKAERFATQGISDPFSDGAVRAFLADGLVPTAGGEPFIELHTLNLDGRPIAIFGAVVGGGRFSGLFTAFNAEPEIARCSPGDILLLHMIRDCCARGLETFDLGVGEAHYKDKICDATEALVETFLPVTAAGRAVALACIGKQRLKTAIKTSQAGKKAMEFVRSLRAKKNGR